MKFREWCHLRDVNENMTLNECDHLNDMNEDITVIRWMKLSRRWLYDMVFHEASKRELAFMTNLVQWVRVTAFVAWLPVLSFQCVKYFRRIYSLGNIVLETCSNVGLPHSIITFKKRKPGFLSGNFFVPITAIFYRQRSVSQKSDRFKTDVRDVIPGFNIGIVTVMSRIALGSYRNKGMFPPGIIGVAALVWPPSTACRSLKILVPSQLSEWEHWNMVWRFH